MPQDEIERLVKEAIDKLDAFGSGDVVIFSIEEANALREVATWYRRVKAVGELGGAVGSAVKWFILIVGAWIAFKAGLLAWIAEYLGKGGGQ